MPPFAGRSTAHQSASHGTASAATRLSVCERSYNPTNGALDLIGVDNGRDKIDLASVAERYLVLRRSVTGYLQKSA